MLSARVEDDETTSKVEEKIDDAEVTIDDLPDEILENIFCRLSTYDDLDCVRVVCNRWRTLAKGTVRILQSQFQQSVLNGELECLVQPFVTVENSRTPPTWPGARFGPMTCYYDKSLYVIGGSTHRNTTFNDMWKFDLGSRTWSRLIPKGQYPSPKALASCVQYKDNIYVLGGWTHASSSPYMAPWRLFDEFHSYNVPTNTWSYIVSSNSPPPIAGQSCSICSNEIVVFGGRTYDQENQRFPVSNQTWIFDFKSEEWDLVLTDNSVSGIGIPEGRYGQTQVTIDENHILIIGGCDGPTKIYDDAWLLNLKTGLNGRKLGNWRKILLSGKDGSLTSSNSHFHYSGIRIGDAVVFFQQASTISPYLAFLHFDWHNLPHIYHEIIFEASAEPFQQRPRSSTALKWNAPNPTAALYTLDISSVIQAAAANWNMEIESKWIRPEERFLYSVVYGRSEIILFGGFFKAPNSRRCRVSNDIFILRTVPRSY